MKKNNASRGFTLVEAIVILVILGILAVILVPQLLGYLDKSGAKACEANRIQLMQYYKAANAFEKPNGGVELTAFVQNIGGVYDNYLAGGATFTCPSGGHYSISRDGSTIVCSLHDGVLVGLLPGYNFVPDISAATETLVFNIRIDSTATNGAFTNQVNAYFETQNIDPAAEGNVNTWSVVREGNTNIVWWTDQDITELEPGTRVKVIRYNPNLKTWTAGYMEVRLHTVGSDSYNVLTGAGSGVKLPDVWTEYKAVTQDATTKASYDQTVAIFNEMPDLLE